MSLRAIWVISIAREDFGSTYLFKQFPTVEKRCKVVYAEHYAALPSPSLFASKILVTFRLSDSKQFVKWRDGVSKTMQLPVVELNINNKTLWPVLAITQDSYLICCLPFIENYKNKDRKNLFKFPSISIGFSVLLSITTVLATSREMQKLIDLENYLSMSMPFGSPLDVEHYSSESMLMSPAQKYFKKQPAWKPVEYRGKQAISFEIIEFVRSVQSPKIDDFEIFGQVAVKADLEGDVSFNSNDLFNLSSLVIHPCVDIAGSLLGSTLPKRLRFSPPSHEFILFRYTSLVPDEPPIKGIFKMLGESDVELFIQLKLSKNTRNSFDFCDVILVFFNRGPVKNMETNANHGVAKLSDDKYTLKWTLGSKFPKDMEVMLKAKLEFHNEPLLPNSDPFCVNKNCYLQINFKQSNTTLSGCNIDLQSVAVTEGNKPRITIKKNVQPSEYRIWNTYGEVPFPTNIQEKKRKENFDGKFILGR